MKFGSSVEFCGGCHAKATGQIGMVRITAESSVAAGVRRIEAITGKAVEEMMDHAQDMIADLRALFNNAPNLMATIEKAINDNKELQAQVDEFKAQKAMQFKETLINKAQTINGVTVISGLCPVDPQNIKDIAFQLRTQFPENLIVALGCETGGKPSITVALSDDLVAAGKNAGKVVREAGKLIQGGGGGQPYFATAGGKNSDGLKAAIDKVVELCL